MTTIERPLSPEAVAARLGDGSPWRLEGAALTRDLTFASFVDAFGFMAQVALVAEKLNHHPDWCNSWNRVSVRITSHDVGGITERCLALTAAIDQILGG